MTELKTCSKCNNSLPLSECSEKNSNGILYRLSFCKQCEYKQIKESVKRRTAVTFSDDLEILITRQYKEIHPQRILDLDRTKILPIGTDEIFVTLTDYPDYWLSNYGRVIRYVDQQYVLLTGRYDSYGTFTYALKKNMLIDGMWSYKKVTFLPAQAVCDEFIVNPDKKNNVYVWHSGGNKEDHYYLNLYPLNSAQYFAVRRHFKETGDDSEEFILKVMNEMKYKPDDWSKKSVEPVVAGVGYRGSSEVDSNSVSYQRWKDMMYRCYNEKLQKRYAKYIGCEVCEEWKNYSSFKVWYDSNIYCIGNERMELDKDILIKGNKVYSPSTCCILPHSVNTLILNSDMRRGSLPLGVHFDNRDKKYCVCMTCAGKSIKYGRFNNVADAFKKYKEEKEKLIQSVAEKYKTKIPYKAYRALMDWKIDIDD